METNTYSGFTSLDGLCGTNLIVRSERALSADVLRFGRWEELCSMLELLVLCEHVYYFNETPLRGKIVSQFPQVFHHIDSSSVEKLIQESQFSYTFHKILMESLGTTVPLREVLHKEEKQRLDDDLLWEYREKVVSHFGPDSQRRYRGSAPLLAWLAVQPGRAAASDSATKYVYRTFVYEAAGRTFQLSVVHDALRLPLAIALSLPKLQTNYQFYWRFSQAVSQLLDGGQYSFYIRPIPAIVLSRCEGIRSRAVQHLGTIRELFSSFRQALSQHETLMNSSAPLGKKQKSEALIKQSMEFLDVLCRKVRQNGVPFYENIIGVLKEGKVAALGKLLNMNLMLEIRPYVSPFGKLLSELLEIEDYPSLIERLWPSVALARAKPFNQVLTQCQASFGRLQ